MENFRLTSTEWRNLLLASAVVGFGLVGLTNRFNPRFLVEAFFMGFAVVTARELGQRVIARLMQVEVDLKLSTEGSAVSVLFSTLGATSGIPLAAFFPVHNEYSVKEYEQWGKGIDAVWMQRIMWLASGAVLGPTVLSVVAVLLGFDTLAMLSVVFTLFQLLPFDYKMIPTGRLDGATLLRDRGRLWILGIITQLILLYFVTG